MKNGIEFRKFPSRPEDSEELIHSPFFPEEIREREGISAKLRRSEKSEWISAKVWRVSPLGTDLVNPFSDAPVKVGDTFDLKISIHGHTNEFSGLAVSAKHKDGEKELIGIRWFEDSTSSSSEFTPDSDRRKTKRWMCSEEFMPTGVSNNPAKFNDFVHFRIGNLSKSGLTIITSLRNKTLIPGMKLSCQVSFPMVGDSHADFLIKNARVGSYGEKDYLILGAELMNPSVVLKEQIAQYLFQFGPATTVKELQEEGLRVRKATVGLSFSYVKSQGDYFDALKLRSKAYLKAGKVQLSGVENMADEFDSRARILLAKYRGQTVGSLRLIFHEMGDQLSLARFASIPDSFPRADEMVESTRVCTDPDFRSSDILNGMVQRSILATILSGRQWILGGAEQKLLPIYSRMGFKPTGVEYVSKDLAGIKHELILGNVRDVILGKNIQFDIWTKMYAELFDYLSGTSLLELSRSEIVRFNVYRAAGRLYRKMGLGRIKPKKSKR